MLLKQYACVCSMRQRAQRQTNRKQMNPDQILPKQRVKQEEEEDEWAWWAWRVDVLVATRQLTTHLAEDHSLLQPRPQRCDVAEESDRRLSERLL